MIEPGRLQKVLAPEVNTELSISDEPILSGIEHAQEYAVAAMKSALAKQPEVIIISPPEDNKQLINTIHNRGLNTEMTQEEADYIQMITGAEMLLRFNISDYGLTPKTWRKGYITFEVTATLALAAVIAYSGSTVAKAAAGAYLVQEAVEETAEAYAGFWGLDVVCRPVRIEAELFNLKPVSKVWSYSNTGLSDVSFSRLTRKVGTEERVNQLDQASNYAVSGIVIKLSNSLKKIKQEPGIKRYLGSE